MFTTVQELDYAAASVEISTSVLETQDGWTVDGYIKTFNGDKIFFDVHNILGYENEDEHIGYVFDEYETAEEAAALYHDFLCEKIKSLSFVAAVLASVFLGNPKPPF